ncbi:MAG: hypothetical protein JWO87_2327 [Phycisphaerales bacterium]|nr:hypothetical protein [Phycisphaerales bacterium]
MQTHSVIDPKYRRPLLVLGLLAASTFLSLGLLVSRWVVGGRFAYPFLVWNLFLAWVPFGFAVALCLTHAGGNPRPAKMVVLGVLWLLFFPNAPYLLTDFVHLGQEHNGPWWCDLMLTIGFAWNGLLLGLLSLFLVQRVVTERVGSGWGRATSAATLILGSFGISLGRFGRFNSWDVVSNPVELLADIISQVLHPMDYPKQFAMAVLLCAFLSLAYLTLLALISLGRDDLQIKDPGIGGMPGSSLFLR